MRFTKRVLGQGQVTIPTDLREAVGIGAGDLVEFEIVGVTRGRNAPTHSPVPSSPQAPSSN